MCFNIALSGLCCAGRSFCNNCCSCCKSCCGTSLKEQIRLGYIFLNLIVFLFSIFVLYFLQQIIDPFIDYVNCPDQSGGKDTCLGVSSVYRFSFILAIMYVFIAVFMICRNEFSKTLNEGLWCFKITYIIAAWFGTLFINNSFFEGYRDVAKVLSIVYLIFQSVCMIEMFYAWGFNWFNKYANQDSEQNKQFYKPQYQQQNQSEQSSYKFNNCFGCILIASALILLVATIVWNVMNFVWFSCGLGVTINLINVILIMLTIVIQILKTGSLIATLSQCLYMTYLTFSAFLSYPEEDCSSLYLDQYALVFELIVSLLILIAICCYITFAKKETSSCVALLPGNVLTSQDDKQLEQKEEIIEDQENNINKVQSNNQLQMQQPGKVQIEVVDKELKRYQDLAFFYFHIIMAFISIYAAMLITNWDSPGVEEQSVDAYKPNWFSFWVKVIVGWVSSLIYIYSIFRKQMISQQEVNEKEANKNVFKYQN